jgi:kynurenine formamidase
MSSTRNAEAPMGLGAELAGGRVIDLEQPRFAGQPGLDQHGAGWQFTLHRRHEPGLARRTSSSGMLISSDHAGTHIDALCHQAVDCVMHGQVAVTSQVQTPSGFSAHGAEEIPPIIGPGVLLDVASGSPLAPRQTVTVADLERAAEGLTIPAGATVLVRTGWAAYWRDAPRYLEAPGLNLAASRWIAARKPVAVGIDNARWDELDVVDPEVGYRSPGHALFLVEEGIYIIENLALEELARSGRRAFTFICLPLKLQGATGSPVRPVALLEGAGA